MSNFKKRFTAIALVFVISFTTGTSAPVVTAKGAKVYIAPYSGTKYHSSRTCRSLRRANEIRKIKKSRAVALGYTKCRICYR